MKTKNSLINNSEKCPPRADTMIHSLRSFGYNITESIADIIDNSISARAENIWIIQNWKGTESWIAILDDGNGMNESELKEAMRMGTKSLDEREDDDLGRFGFGLKTASFAQCDKLTVRSKQNNSLSDDNLNTISSNLNKITSEVNMLTDNINQKEIVNGNGNGHENGHGNGHENGN